MRRLLAIAILLIATAAFGVSDLGNPAVTRLWGYDQAGDRGFVCTASYVERGDEVTWVLTAGHCAENGDLVARDTTGYVFYHVDWRITVQSHVYFPRVVDFALGSAPPGETAKRLRLASKLPPPGSMVYIHGFGMGVERVVPAQVTTFEEANLPGAVVLIAPGTGLDLWPGHSGSPVLNVRGELVGVVWGRVPKDPDEHRSRILITPVEVIRQIIDAVK